MTVLDSTLSGNSAPSGGAIFNGFPVSITGIVSTLNVGGCTLSGNGISADVGGGIFNGGCLMSLKNTILNGSPGDPKPVSSHRSMPTARASSPRNAGSFR